MNRHKVLVCAALIAIALSAAGCNRQAAVEPSEPSKLTPVAGSDLSRIALTDVARKNLGIETTAVRSESASGSAGGSAIRLLVMPASALVFNAQGQAYAYTSPSPGTYVRAGVTVKEYRGQDVIMTAGPPLGTQVVTVGDPELLGIEYGVGEE